MSIFRHNMVRGGRGGMIRGGRGGMGRGMGFPRKQFLPLMIPSID